MINRVELKKISYIFVLLLFIFLIAGIPTLCEILLQDNDKISYWDGSIADSYHGGRGTESDPYIINTPSEFAYFSKQVSKGNTYENTYFKLTSDIYINRGVFDLEEDVPIYLKNYKKYFIKNQTNEFYANTDYNDKVGEINIFPTIGYFKGIFDGNNKNIYGLYLTADSNGYTGLFNNLQGTVNNLFIKNSLIIGNKASLITRASNAFISDIGFSGIIKSNEAVEQVNKKLEDIIIENTLEYKIELPKMELPNGYSGLAISVTGKYETSNNENIINVNGNEYTNGTFEITNVDGNQLIINSIGENEVIKLTDINYRITYNYSTASLINYANNTVIENTYSKGMIISDTVAAGLICTLENESIVKNSYSSARIVGTKIGGLIYSTKDAILDIERSFVFSDIEGNESSSFIGIVDLNTSITIKNSFTTGNVKGDNISNFIGNAAGNVSFENVYSTILNTDENVEYNPIVIELSKLKDKTFVTETLGFLEYNKDNLINSSNVWVINNGMLPYLYTDDVIAPNISVTFGNKVWNDYLDATEIIKNPSENQVEINYDDRDSVILKTEYYISNNYNDVAMNVEDIPWKIYNGEKISFNKSGNYTIYVKVTDASFNISYVHSDMIVYDNYQSKIVDYITNKDLKDYGNQITSSSIVKYIFEREYLTNNTIYENTDKLYLKGNIPLNTKIYLYDYKFKEFYYTVISDVGSELYNLGNFVKLGTDLKINFDNNVNNYYFNGKFQERFEFIFDFSNIKLTNNYEMFLELIVMDSENNILTSSTNESLFLIDKISDGSSALPSIKLESNVDGYFEFLEGSSLNVPLNVKMEYKTFNDKNVYDSNVQENKLDLQLRILDGNKERLNSKEVRNLFISFNDRKYYFNDESEVLIADFQEFNSSLSFLIKSLKAPLSLKNGTYYIELTEVLNNKIKSNTVLIPIKVNNEKAIRSYNYNVVWNGTKIWNRKKENELDVLSEILYEGDLENPNIRVFLYEKVNFDFLSQEYQKLNINDYLKIFSNDKEYYFLDLVDNTNNLKLRFDVSKMSLGGYKIIYKLYDGNSFVAEDVEAFIVK